MSEVELRKLDVEYCGYVRAFKPGEALRYYPGVEMPLGIPLYSFYGADGELILLTDDMENIRAMATERELIYVRIV